MPSTIDDLPEDRFVAGWRCVVGEAPAAMLDDRRAMIALLVETSPVIAWTDGRASLPRSRRGGRAGSVADARLDTDCASPSGAPP